MTPQQIAQSLAIRKAGCFFTVKVRRPCKTRKGIDSIIEKESVYQGQLCDYSAKSAVRQGIESGERDAPELPKGMKESFKDGNAKFYNGFNDQKYFGVVVDGNKPKSKYYKNGQIVEKDQILDDLLASEKSPPKTKQELAEKCQSPFVLIKCENILEIA